MTRLRLGCQTLRIQTGKYENKRSINSSRRANMFSMQRKLHRTRTAFLDVLLGVYYHRRELRSYISNMDAIYQRLSDNERTKYLLRVDNENKCKIIGKYIHLMFTKKKRDSQFINVISIIYIFIVIIIFSNLMYTNPENIISNLY